MRKNNSLVRLKCFRAVWAAALALPIAAGLAAPADPSQQTAPTISDATNWDAPVGVRIYIRAEDAFDNAGTNPRITAAEFPTTEYYDLHEIAEGTLVVRAKTNAELNALLTPPPSPFTVNVTVTMANDEGQSAEGAVTLETVYDRATPEQPSEPPAPTISITEAIAAPPGVVLQIPVDEIFDNAGTNPRITGAVFSVTEWYGVYEFNEETLFVQAKPNASLNRLPPPPPNPFTVDVAVTMTNDEGQAAEGTVTFETEYERVPQSGGPEAPAPTFSRTEAVSAPAGVLVYALATDAFDNAGTNPRITGAEFSSAEWYSVHEIREGALYVQPKTSAELSALPTPPPNPFTVDVAVTMANDEGRTAEGTITFETVYERDTPDQSGGAPAPVFAQTETIAATAGATLILVADRVFDNAGEDPRFFYPGRVHPWTVLRGETQDRLTVHIPTSEILAELDAPPAPPEHPFAFLGIGTTEPPPPPDGSYTFGIEVGMFNREMQRAEDTVKFEVAYEVASPTPSQPGDPGEAVPTFTQTQTIVLTPGMVNVFYVDRVFDNAGTNPSFTGVGFEETDILGTFKGSYIDDEAPDRLTIPIDTVAGLNALPTPPDSPFTFRAQVSMTNDEGQSASGTFTFQVSYERIPVPTFSQTETVTAAPGLLMSVSADGLFDNAGTNPKITAAEFSSAEWYRVHEVRDGVLYVQPRTAAELIALPTPPPSPFTVTADVTMTNDEGRTVEGTIAFETAYERADGAQQ